MTDPFDLLRDELIRAAENHPTRDQSQTHRRGSSRWAAPIHVFRVNGAGFAILAAVLVVVVVLAAALGVGTTHRTIPGAHSLSPHGRAAITGAIQLDQHDVQAGGTLRGRIVFENRTSSTRVLERGCKVDGLYAVGLRASDGSLQSPAFSLVGCSPEQELIARPGQTTYPFKLQATYGSCLQRAKGQGSRGSASWMPPCLENAEHIRDIAPPLPVGIYTAVFVPDGKWHGPRVQPARLRVIHNK